MTVPQAERTAPLAGVKVVDIANFLAAPLCGMHLADFGADVIKVERPNSGDEIRYWGDNKNGVGLYFKIVNRNKRSVTADLRTPLGVEIVKRLVQDADILLENYRTGTLEKWGLGPDVLMEINPGLIIVRITGFGQTGPNRHRPGFGTLAEAYAGYAHITGFPDRPPLLPAFGLADSTTGLMAAYLASMALHEKRRSGKGQIIDLAIYETLLTLLGPQVINYDQLGLVQQRAGSRLPFTAPRNTYPTRDGKWVSIGGSAQSIFERICQALGVPEIVKDPRFKDNRLRIQNAAALDEALQKATVKFDQKDLIELLIAHDAAISPVNDIAQIFEDPHIQARGNIVPVEDDELGKVRMQDVVGKFSRTPGKIRSTGPRLGEHNQEVLVDLLGFKPEELEAAGIALNATTD
jgi:crotonobetainyl-CoA:carnitine CoA-transferase CaiB-like acyl-CoA transferase